MGVIEILHTEKPIAIFNIICYTFLSQVKQYEDSSLVALFGNGKGDCYEYVRNLNASLSGICRFDLHR